MFWRRAESALTADERWSYKHHRARLLTRHYGHLTPGLIRCLEANASRLARHPEVQTREWGLNMRGKRAAKAAHASIRAKGKTPGDQGRAVIGRNRAERTEQKCRDKIAQLSAVTTAAKGPDGLTAEQREANRMIVEGAAEVERARVERLAREWRDKQERLRRTNHG